MHGGRVQGQVREAVTPRAIPDWDQLATGRSFYSSADWLLFADTDQVARSRYAGLSVGGRLVAALSSHRAPEEVDAGYVATRALQLPAGSPPVGETVLTLGGRRGFLSSALVAMDLGRSAAAGYLAELIGDATRAGDPAWWWPYLSTPDAELVLAAATRLGGTERPGVHLLDADCVIDVAGTRIEDHIAALPTRQRRTNFRREDRRFTDSGLTIRLISLAEYWPRLGPLLAAVQHRYGHRQPANQLSARLRSQGEYLASRAVVFGCFDANLLVGFSLAYRWGDELVLRVVGFDYDRLPGADEYAQVTVHAPLRYCYRHGLRRLQLGTGSYAAKCRRGASVRPLWAVTSLSGPDSAALTTAARRLTASMPAHEAEAFAAQIVTRF
jgi:hypothetical protein